jgi:hypothetical protein
MSICQKNKDCSCKEAIEAQKEQWIKIQEMAKSVKVTKVKLKKSDQD